MRNKYAMAIFSSTRLLKIRTEIEWVSNDGFRVQICPVNRGKRKNRRFKPIILQGTRDAISWGMELRASKQRGC